MAAAAAPPGLLIGSAEGLSQRLPRPDPADWIELSPGGPLDPELLATALQRLGYAPDESVDPAGEAVIPADNVADEAARVGLHGRLAGLLRGTDTTTLDEFGDELEDRFGEAPEPLANLLAMGRLAIRARAAGVAGLEAGPAAVATDTAGCDA